MTSANRLVPIIGVMVLMIAGAVAMKSCGSRSPNSPAQLKELPEAPSPDVDTPADTVRALSAQIAELNDRSETLIRENRALRTQNEALVARQTQIMSEVDQRVRTHVNQIQGDRSGALSALTARIDALSTRLSTGAAGPESGLGVERPARPSGTQAGTGGGWSDIPVGLGYEAGPGSPGLLPATPGPVQWIEPLDGGAGSTLPPGMTASAQGPGRQDSPPSLLSQAGGAVSRAGDGLAGVAARRVDGIGRAALAEPVPHYTIPANATLMGSTAFTALVGRVPIGGQVQDPMPFKVLIGAENLAANGHRIPGLTGMVMSGYAVGDWTLSCVNGRILSATYVFEDGTVKSFGDPSTAGRTANSSEKTLGWISDRMGVPCVSGKRITNAPAFLAQRVGITALSAAAEAAAAAQTTSVVSDNGASTSSVTGDITRYTLGRTVSTGAEEVGRWLQERQAQSFDAIFVGAGRELVVHLDVELPIDLDPAGRRIDYHTTRSQGGFASAYLD